MSRGRGTRVDVDPLSLKSCRRGGLAQAATRNDSADRNLGGQLRPHGVVVVRGAWRHGRHVPRSRSGCCRGLHRHVDLVFGDKGRLRSGAPSTPSPAAEPGTRAWASSRKFELRQPHRYRRKPSQSRSVGSHRGAGSSTAWTGTDAGGRQRAGVLTVNSNRDALRGRLGEVSVGWRARSTSRCWRISMTRPWYWAGLGRL